MELWYKDLGFYNNPFSIKPLAFHDEIIGNNIRDVISKIEKGNVLFIEGEYGNGKTSVLKRIVREFGGSRRLVYYSCNRTDKNIDFDNLLTGRYGIIGRLFGIKPKDMILLLDEAQELSCEDLDRLKSYYKKHFWSIVLVGYKYNNLQVNGFKEIIGDNILSLRKLNVDEAIRLVRRRIGTLNFLSDNIIKTIFERSKMNPRRLLKNCEEVCKYAYSKGASQVTAEHIDKTLPN